MPNLRLLAIHDKIMHPQWSETDNLILLPKNFKLPNKLRYVYWRNIPSSSLSLTCWPQKLVKLYIRHSNIEKLWDRTQNLPSLEGIDLTACSHLIECPNLDGSPNLKYIRLRNCKNLPDVHPSVFSLPKIQKLDVRDCKALKRLCSDYCSPSLRQLEAMGCSNLEEFSVPIVAHRSKITLSSTALNEVPTNILHLQNVGFFSFNMSYSLEKLPSNFVTSIMLTDPVKREDDTCIMLSRILPTPAFLSLNRLCLFRCKSLSKLPDNIDVLQSLQALMVTQCPIISLPEKIKNLRQLILLEIFGCEILQYVPPLPSSIVMFCTMDCKSLETISSLTCKLPLRKHAVVFGFYNTMNLDKHAYEAVLKDLKFRIELGAEDVNSNDEIDGGVCYFIPYKSNMPNDCFPQYYSKKASVVIVEAPPDHWISSGLVFYLHFSQYQSCVLDNMIFGCECYLQKSSNEWERIASSDLEWFGESIYPENLTFKMKSDHMALWYDAECCNTIMKAIKEGESDTTCNPILKFEFYAQLEDNNVEVVTKGCGIRWMHVDFVKDKGRSSQAETGVVKRLQVGRRFWFACRDGEPKGAGAVIRSYEREMMASKEETPSNVANIALFDVMGSAALTFFQRKSNPNKYYIM
ncbi:hypothetical protein PIB30_084293 [Stylosanthes scabra]|uniref:Uncharacterized protein n=1 Tax=Stylosanthes scabra TaxID=79078 RepID=A0ABU6XRW8_9FABA|nr:hypothetical protein [Stylosanthes scabra]